MVQDNVLTEHAESHSLILEPVLLRLRMLAIRLHVQVALRRLHRRMPQVIAHHQERYPRIELMRRCRMPQPVRRCRLQQPGLLWIWTGLGC